MEVIPFNVATAAKRDESYAEEVSEVVTVDIPVTTLAALREHLVCMELTIELAKSIIDNQVAQHGEPAARKAVLELLMTLTPYLASYPPKIPAE